MNGPSAASGTEFAVTEDDGEVSAALLVGQAVSYLRVSSKRQLDTAVDVDPDGNSIATQREYCQAKAGTMGVEIQREFVEPGTSGQTIEKRPVFRELLHYLGEHPEIDYVIIYMRSRAFRNFTDSAITKRELLKKGIRLISAKEDFGEGIMADAMEAVSDIMNEVQVRLSGEDIKTKMRHKAVNGGTLGRARLGYCNVRIEHEGRLINSIALDEERAPLVKIAWELYASGDYSLDRLQAAMADQGLTTRPSARWSAQGVSVNKLHQMLRDPYYTGVVTYQGEIFPGRHPVIVNQPLFDRVQEVMDLRSKRGQRDRVHQHYLKGSLFCDRCRKAGRTSRLIYTEASGRGGIYAYYLCRGRQDKLCDLPYLGAGQVEDKIAEHYSLLQLPEDFATAVRERLEETMAEEQSTVRELHANLKRQLAKLDTAEERLLDLAADGSLPQAKIRQRLHKIRLERGSVQEGLGQNAEQLAVGAEVLRTALDLLSDPAKLYGGAADAVRRQLNETFFQRFYLDDHGAVTESLLNWPFDEITEAKTFYCRQVGRLPSDGVQTGSPKHPANAGAPVVTMTGSLARVFEDAGSSKTVMVGRAGLEPATERL